MCVVKMEHMIEVIPKIGSEILSDGRMVSKPLEDMCPYLSREEFNSLMIVKPYEQS